MPSIIRILDDKTINQIAAGEVIENPSSVIKELIENALDAEASSITIEVEASGRHLIRVSDNGVGMTRDDALLCFERHATSKVQQIEDLDSLFSMGFRGEALASIASISKVRLMTRPRDAKEGTLVEIYGGKLINCTSIPCDFGTSFDISDLFYNVPARRKFLKSPAHDLLEIQKMVTQICFANPHVHFLLLSDGKIELDAPLVPSYIQRAEGLLNESVFECMTPFQYEEGPMKIEGLLGIPTLHRPNRTGQSLFINQRPVVSWEIAQAVLEGYGTALPERRYPVFHLHLKIPPHEFDINVHPQKKEVRFCHLFQIKEMIRKAVLKTITHPLPKIEQEPISWTAPPSFSIKKESINTPFIKTPFPSPFFEKEESVPIQKTFELTPKLPRILVCIPFYILLEDPNGLKIVDIQRARKRIIYENVLLKSHLKALEKQLLLVPLSLSLSNESSALLIQHLEAFEAAGFNIRPFGKMTFMIESLPPMIKEEEAEPMILEILKGLQEEKKEAAQSEIQAYFAESAIKQVKSESRILSIHEAETLMNHLFSCQQPNFTPSGQSILGLISHDDLGKFIK